MHARSDTDNFCRYVHPTMAEVISYNLENALLPVLTLMHHDNHILATSKYHAVVKFRWITRSDHIYLYQHWFTSSFTMQF